MTIGMTDFWKGIYAWVDLQVALGADKRVLDRAFVLAEYQLEMLDNETIEEAVEIIESWVEIAKEHVTRDAIEKELNKEKDEKWKEWALNLIKSDIEAEEVVTQEEEEVMVTELTLDQKYDVIAEFLDFNEAQLLDLNVDTCDLFDYILSNLCLDTLHDVDAIHDAVEPLIVSYVDGLTVLQSEEVDIASDFQDSIDSLDHDNDSYIYYQDESTEPVCSPLQPLLPLLILLSAVLVIAISISGLVFKVCSTYIPKCYKWIKSIRGVYIEKGLRLHLA